MTEIKYTRKLFLGVPLLFARQLFLRGLLQLGKTGHKNTFNSIQRDLLKAGVPAWVNPDEVLHSLAQGTAHLPPKTKELSIVQSACSSWIFTYLALPLPLPLPLMASVWVVPCPRPACIKINFNYCHRHHHGHPHVRRYHLIQHHNVSYYLLLLGSQGRPHLRHLRAQLRHLGPQEGPHLHHLRAQLGHLGPQCFLPPARARWRVTMASVWGSIFLGAW